MGEYSRLSNGRGFNGYDVRKILENAEHPTVWLSFGKDSLLVLRMALEAGFDGPCYFFGDQLSDLAQQTILEHDLTVYSWPASDRYLIPDGDSLAQVDEYQIGVKRIPFISPVVTGEHCDHGEYQRFSRSFAYPHDVTLTGYKRSDWNEAVGVTFPQEINIGVTRLVHPLYDWTDGQVIEALGFTPPEENTVEYCNECLAMIESSDWDRDAALVNFRRRFNFH